MVNESICAEFPNTWEEFVEKWAYDIDIFNKEDEAETAHEKVVDVYRVKQMMWYYLRDYIKLGNAYSSEDYIIDIVPDETKNSIYGTPHFVVRRRFQ